MMEIAHYLYQRRAYIVLTLTLLSVTLTLINYNKAMINKAQNLLNDSELYFDIALQSEQAGNLIEAAFYLELAVMAEEEANELNQEHEMCLAWESIQLDGYLWGLVV